MDAAGWVLLIGTGLWVVMLFAVETYTAMHGQPTISDRVRALGKSATIVIVATCLAIGLLLGHFWASW